jgi:predicted transposase YdaD
MKTDILFYKLIEVEPALLLHLANIIPPPNVRYQFQAIELKDVAKRTDAVLVPDSTEAPLIIAEVQYWRDETIFHRTVNEAARLLLKMPDYTRLQMVVIFPYEATHPGSSVWQGLEASGVLRVVIVERALEQMSDNPSATAFATPEEQSALQLIRWTITPQNEADDRAMLQTFSANVAATKNQALQRMFRDLFVSLYTSKYKHLSLDEVRAMINTAEIFDDIRESLAVQQYGEEVAAQVASQVRMENGLAMLNAGISLAQTASILNLSEDALRNAWQEQKDKL